MTYDIKRESNDGTIKWTNTVIPVTAYRTDLASGVTAEQVAYSDAKVNLTYTGGYEPSGAAGTSTVYEPTTASA